VLGLKGSNGRKKLVVYNPPQDYFKNSENRDFATINTTLIKPEENATQESGPQESELIFLAYAVVSIKFTYSCCLL
jgi:hypothetical protein